MMMMTEMIFNSRDDFRSLDFNRRRQPFVYDLAEGSGRTDGRTD